LYAAGGCRVMPCPNAEACILDAFWLPHRVLLADDDSIAEVIEVIRAALVGRKETTAAKTLGVAERIASRPGAAS
jgi:hypothetical protein